jgi:hypothetical protein
MASVFGSSVALMRDEDYWARVDQSGGPDACWPWTKATSRGYGVVSLGDTTQGAHVRAFILTGGILYPGEQVDHRCHDPQKCAPGPGCPHRRCCNPAHLAADTPQGNTLRGGGPAAVNAAKTACPSCGSAYAVTNNGWRMCPACQHRNVRKYRDRVRSGERVIATKKLSTEQIEAIKSSTDTVRSLATEYGVSVSLISEARRGWVQSESYCRTRR